MNPLLKPKFNIGDQNLSKIRLLWILFYPFFIAFLTEWIQRNNLYDLSNWILYKPINLYLSCLFVLAIFLIFYGLSSRIWIASVISGCLPILFGLINFFKQNYRSEPLLPWDFFLSKEAFKILDSITVHLEARHFLILVILFGLLFMPFYLRKTELLINYRNRLLISTFGLCIFFSLFNFIFLSSNGLISLNISDIRWNQSENYAENGFLTGFLINVKNVIIEKPEDYSYASLKNILEPYTNEKVMASNFSKNVTSIKPNIIFVMNESLFDPTILPNVDFSSNPVAIIDETRKNETSGSLLVSEFGGGTANTEFEVLTGNKTLYLPKGSMAYQQYIKNEILSLPSFLNEKNYKTLAIHPYADWFWNRNTVYPNMGFDEFISMDDFVDPEIAGNLISDKSAVNRVIEEFENNQSSDDPFFCFLVTMQNHCGYYDKGYSEYDVTVSSSALDDDSLIQLRNYVQGVHDADEAYGILIDYFKKIDEPTIVVMFGDHLPALGEDYGVYRELSYLTSAEPQGQDYINLYSTPVVLYSNTNLISPQDLGTVDANLLGITILDKCGFSLPPYWEFLLDEQADFNQNNYITLTKDGTIVDGVSTEAASFNQKQWLVEYDILFGAHYLNHLEK